MKKLLLLIPLVALMPLFASATSHAIGQFSGVSVLFGNFTNFINNALVPFIFAIALIVFIWGVFQTFILGGDNEEKQEKGKKLMLYAIIGFVVMISIWGIVNLIAGGLGLNEGLDPASLPRTPGIGIPGP